jgi:hypothetical protein
VSGMFLDPQRPLTTCSAKTCAGCPLSKEVHCHFVARDLVAFVFAFLPGLFVGGVGVYEINAWWLLPWLVTIVGYFGFVEIRVMCSHCPHYAEPGQSLQCWANYGAPRLWNYRPGPMSLVEKSVFMSGLVLVWGYPLAFLLVGWQWLLLFMYLLATASFFVTLRRSFCSQCMNFACPLNSVGQPVRAEFFERNPTVARAWQARGAE